MSFQIPIKRAKRIQKQYMQFDQIESKVRTRSNESGAVRSSFITFTNTMLIERSAPIHASSSPPLASPETDTGPPGPAAALAANALVAIAVTDCSEGCEGNEMVSDVLAFAAVEVNVI